MRKLIAIVMMVFAVAMLGCSDKKQQYIDDLSRFVNMAGRQHIKNTLAVTESRHGFGKSEYFNANKRAELTDSMAVIDSLYIALSEPPTEYEQTYTNIRTIYQDLKKYEDMLTVMYESSDEYNSSVLTTHLDSIGAYNARFEKCFYNLKADIPQAFSNGGK